MVYKRMDKVELSLGSLRGVWVAIGRREVGRTRGDVRRQSVRKTFVKNNSALTDSLRCTSYWSLTVCDRGLISRLLK